MIVHTTSNILVGPLILLIWVIDIYVFLASVRLILGRWPRSRDSRFYHHLELFTNPVAEMVDKYLRLRQGRPTPSGAAWVIVLFGGIILRHLLAWVIIRFF